MSKVMAVVTDSDTPKDEIEKLRSKDIAAYVV